MKSFTSGCAYIFMTQISSITVSDRMLSASFLKLVFIRSIQKTPYKDYLLEDIPLTTSRKPTLMQPVSCATLASYGGCKCDSYMTYFRTLLSSLVKEGRQKLSQEQKKTDTLHYLLWPKILFVSMSWSLKITQPTAERMQIFFGTLKWEV